MSMTIDDPQLNTLYDALETATNAILAAQNTVMNFTTKDGGPIYSEGEQTIVGAKTFNASPKVPNTFGTTLNITATDFEVSMASCFTKLVSANTTFTFSGVPTDKYAKFTLVLTNGGSKTVTWPANVKWAGGQRPTLTTTGTDVLEFMTPNGGAVWYGYVRVLNAR